MKRLVSAKGMTEPNKGAGKGHNVKNFVVDVVYSVLQKANRNADRNYVSEVFKVSWSLYLTGYLLLFSIG